MRKILGVLLALLFALAPSAPVFAQQGGSKSDGDFVADNYLAWGGVILSGNSATGSQTITIAINGSLSDGRPSPPPVVGGSYSFDIGTNNETVVLTAVSTASCTYNGFQCYNVTGSFNNLHGASQARAVATATAGLQEAGVDAYLAGGGEVTVSRASNATDAMFALLVPYPNVWYYDKRTGGAAQFWTLVGNVTVLAAPTTLTSSTVGDALTGTLALATGGFYTNANAYHVCIAYVDVLGQEGPCSADYSFTPATGSTNQIGFTTPAASTGAVGYTIYIGLTNGGSTTLYYKVPLVVQPTVIGTAPAAGVVCTLTAVETVTPACAVTNTTYGQTGSQAVVSALTLSTSPIPPQKTIVSSTTVYVPTPGGRTVYLYEPGMHIGTPGIPAETLAFTITTAEATIVPDVAGTVNIKPGFMNFPGRTLRICGEATSTATAATIEDIQFQWDAIGQNTAGKGVLIGDLSATNTLATTGHLTFCQDFQTTVASASATGGSINHINGWLGSAGVTTAAAAGGGDVVTPGAIGSLNLAEDARINVIVLHTTSTDGAGWIIQGLTSSVVN